MNDRLGEGEMADMVLVLLAAGDSRRFQGNKLLHLVNGKPMYRHVADEVERLLGDFFSEKLAVTQYGEIMCDLPLLGYQVIENRESALGISYSIHLALKAVASRDAALCFAVCDQPYLKAETIRGLAEGWRLSGKGIGALGHRGRLGNPVIFSPRYRDELMALTGDVGGRRVVGAHPDDLYVHEVEDERELEDMDFREEG